MANYNMVRFDHVSGPGKGQELPMAASQAFARRGGKFVYISSAGTVTKVGGCGTSFRGWASVPKDTNNATNFWTSSSTANKDKVFVISGLEDIFEIPYYSAASASVNATDVGVALGIYDNDGVQSAATSCNTASECLIVTDYDTNENTVLVRIDPDFFA